MDAHAEVPFIPELLGGPDHVQAAVHAVEHRIVGRFSQEPRGGHEGVADRLDLLHVMAQRDLLPVLDQLFQVQHHLFGLMADAVRRETDHVAEEDGDIFVTTRLDFLVGLHLPGDLAREDDLQQLVGPLLLLADILQQTLLDQAGIDPGLEEHLVEGFGEIIIAPILMQPATASSSSSAEIMMTGMWRRSGSSLSRLRTAKPFISGMMMSRSTRSTGLVRTMSRA